MLETLRDPIWNSISAIVAIIALIFAFYQDKRKIPNLNKVIKSTGRILLGVMVFFIGPALEFTVFNIFRGGLPMAIDYWQMEITLGILERDMIRSLFFSIFVGSIVVASIPKTTPKRPVLRTIFITIIALWITDVFFFIFRQNGTSPLIFAIFSDIVGGFIGGLIVLWSVKIYDENFDSKES